MAIILGGGGGSSGGSPFPTMVFQQSIIWACPVVMDVLVYVIGGGGGGSMYSGTDKNAGGGGAGGCAVSRLTLAVQNYTLTIGSGGAGINNQYNPGVTGGNTSMSGSGMTTMTGNGGNGGTQAPSTVITGGTASGGTLQNNTGGGVPSLANTAYAASGGGGVGLYGPGIDGVWNTNNDGTAAGGSPMGITPQQTSTSSRGANNNKMNHVGGYLSNGPIGVDIFTGFSRAQASSSISATTSYFKTTGAATQMNLVSGVFYANPAGPFSGGMGFGYGGSTTKYAGAGTAGGGGGGCNDHGASGTTVGGGGGGGLIIMIPISMGD